jgi:hypothetical protein
MESKQITLKYSTICSVLFFFLFSNIAFSQAIATSDSLQKVKADSLKTAQADTLKKSVSADTIKAATIAPAIVPAVVPVVAPAQVVPTESVPAVAPATAPAETPKVAEESNGDDKDKKKDKKGKKNEIVFYSGANFTQLYTSDAYKSEAAPGYQIGAYYKQGRLFYWQAGARFASAQFGYKHTGSVDTADFVNVQFSDLDFPVTLGVNFTSFMNRVLSVRLFASAVPALTLKVGDNPFGITKDKVNSFILYGQGGLGINVAFMVIEAGYNYGFNELLIGNTDSKPGQIFINLGFRF